MPGATPPIDPSALGGLHPCSGPCPPIAHRRPAPSRPRLAALVLDPRRLQRRRRQPVAGADRLDDRRDGRRRPPRRSRPPARHRVPAFPATLTDDEKNAVTIPAEPKKIVSLTPAATEILFALGAGPRVVAGTDVRRLSAGRSRPPRRGDLHVGRRREDRRHGGRPRHRGRQLVQSARGDHAAARPRRPGRRRLRPEPRRRAR